MYRGSLYQGLSVHALQKSVNAFFLLDTVCNLYAPLIPLAFSLVPKYYYVNAYDIAVF